MQHTVVTSKQAESVEDAGTTPQQLPAGQTSGQAAVAAARRQERTCSTVPSGGALIAPERYARRSNGTSGCQRGCVRKGGSHPPLQVSPPASADDAALLGVRCSTESNPTPAVAAKGATEFGAALQAQPECCKLQETIACFPESMPCGRCSLLSPRPCDGAHATAAGSTSQGPELWRARSRLLDSFLESPCTSAAPSACLREFWRSVLRFAAAGALPVQPV